MVTSVQPHPSEIIVRDRSRSRTSPTIRVDLHRASSRFGRRLSRIMRFALFLIASVWVGAACGDSATPSPADDSGAHKPDATPARDSSAAPCDGGCHDAESSADAGVPPDAHSVVDADAPDAHSVVDADTPDAHAVLRMAPRLCGSCTSSRRAMKRRLSSGSCRRKGSRPRVSIPETSARIPWCLAVPAFASREEAEQALAHKPTEWHGFVARGVNRSPMHQAMGLN